jgi:hypothetical protein
MMKREDSMEMDRALWKPLYELAAQVRKLAPWDWMSDSDIFGIGLPDGRCVFVNVLGEKGEHLAVCVYPGIEAITQFRAVLKLDNPTAEDVLEIPQHQMVFEDRAHLDPDERRRPKELGLSFRGAQAWPRFRTYSPGFLSYPSSSEDLGVVRIAIEQLLEIAERFQREAPWVPEHPNVYLVREQDGAGVWRDSRRTIPPADPPRYIGALSEAEAAQWAALRLGEGGLELDCFLLMTPIWTGKAHPFYPYLLLGLDTASGAVLFHDSLTVDDTVQEMFGRIPGRLVAKYTQLGYRPEEIVVRPGRLATLLETVAGRLSIPIRTRRNLPCLDPAKESFIAFMMRS